MIDRITGDERRERQHQAVREEIKQAAWLQIAEKSASSLSLRAVASSIGLSAPALYRYFPSKNDLVTALIIDAFLSLAASQKEILAGNPGAGWKKLLIKLGLDYRDWALETPAAFYLIFGDPVPGYEAPFEKTMPAAGESLRALISVLEQALQDGDLTLPLNPAPVSELENSFKKWSDLIYNTHPDILYLAFIISTRVQGMMLIELGKQLPPFFKDGEELYKRELERIVASIT